MKICRFNDDRLGVVDGEDVIDVTGALDVIPPSGWPAPNGDALIANLDAVCAKASVLAATGERHALSSVVLKSPVANPNKVIGAPVNYYAHQDEAIEDTGVNFGREIKTIDHYGLFLKNPVLVGAGEGVDLHFTDRRNDHEVEFVIVIGKQGSRIKRENALDYIAGYTLGLDMTVRGVEDRSFRKSCDGYAPMGPYFVTADEIPDPNNVDFTVHVNGEIRQDAHTKDLIFDIERLIEFASEFYTIYPGDVLFTGSPPGVSEIHPGDVMRCNCDLIGEMSVTVREAE